MTLAWVWQSLVDLVNSTANGIYSFIALVIALFVFPAAILVIVAYKAGYFDKK